MRPWLVCVHFVFASIVFTQDICIYILAEVPFKFSFATYTRNQRRRVYDCTTAHCVTSLRA